MLTTFKANVARSVALSDVAVLLMQKCEAWYKASQARKAAATVSQYCWVAGSSMAAALLAATGVMLGVPLSLSLRLLAAVCTDVAISGQSARLDNS